MESKIIIELKDVLDALPPILRTIEVRDALTVAYYRGAINYKQDPEYFEKIQTQRIITASNKINNG